MQTAAKSVEIAESSWEESVSAWMDGEDSDDIFPSLLSKEGRQTWDTYHLIDDSLRIADLALTPSAAIKSSSNSCMESGLRRGRAGAPGFAEQQRTRWS